jgi:hypothetical protein
MDLILSIATVSLLAGVVYLIKIKYNLEEKLQVEKVKLNATTQYAESLAIKVTNLQRALDVCQATSPELPPNKKNKNPKKA